MKNKKKKLNGQLKAMKKVRKPMPPKTTVIKDKKKEKLDKVEEGHHRKYIGYSIYWEIPND